MSSPLKKTKQSSLSQFYRKLQHHQEEPHQKNSSSTPIKKNKSSIEYDEQNKFAGKINSHYSHSQLNYYRMSHPLISQQGYSELNINSNMKIKMSDILKQEDNIINRQEITKEQEEYKQNLFKGFNQNPFKKQDNLLFQQLNNNQPSDIMTQKFENQQSSFDYNLSVEPEQIKVPSSFKNSQNENIGIFNRKETKITHFKLNDDSRLQSNFLITPQNSLIKSPQKVNERQAQQIRKFTPQTDKLFQNQIIQSEIVERLNFKEINQKNKNTQPLDAQIFFSNQNNKKIKHQQVASISPSSIKSDNQIMRAANQQNSPSVSPKRPPSYTQYRNNNIKSPIIKQSSPTMISPKKQYINTKRVKDQLLSSDDQDSSQLLSKLKQLQSQVQLLKSHKYQYTISKYRQQIRSQLQKRFQSQSSQIRSKHGDLQKQLIKQKQSSIFMFQKSLQDIKKHKSTYLMILQQLKENKSKIDQQYGSKVQQVKRFKQRMINQWKRQSNEQIKKIVNGTHSQSHGWRLGK